MKCIWLLPAVYVLAGCSPPREQIPPKAYAALTDRLLARFPLLSPLGEVCVRAERRITDPQCYRFDAQKRWAGVIVQEHYFENSFYPGRTDRSVTSHGARFAVTGLPSKRDCRSPLCRPLLNEPADANRPRMAFYVEFIGRRTATLGRYGHSGIFAHKIIVDRLLTARPINLGDRTR